MFSRKEIVAEVGRLDNWRHRIDVGQGVTTPGREDSQEELRRIRLPENLHGKKVLDIGCSDGFFCFECESRGAEVVGVENFLSTPFNEGENGFSIVKKLIDSKVVLIRQSVYDLDAANIGMFHIILFLNVLYHLKNPLFALDKLHNLLLPNGTLILKTHYHQDVRIARWGIDFTKRPIMRFYESDELNNDASNWWAPNKRCVESMLRATGFRNVKLLETFSDRAYYRCLK